jgi:plastocyanin domain-containing protein
MRKMRILVGMALLVFPLTACGGADEAPDAPADETPAAEAPASAAVEAETPEELQIVRVRVEGDAYLFSPEVVEAGKPVRLVFDPNGLPGCSRDVVVPAFDIGKVISAEDATIEFTPEAPGPIAVACSMDMYRGTLLAE